MSPNRRQTRSSNKGKRPGRVDRPETVRRTSEEVQADAQQKEAVKTAAKQKRKRALETVAEEEEAMSNAKAAADEQRERRYYPAGPLGLRAYASCHDFSDPEQVAHTEAATERINLFYMENLGLTFPRAASEAPTVIADNDSLNRGAGPAAESTAEESELTDIDATVRPKKKRRKASPETPLRDGVNALRSKAAAASTAGRTS
ncbi:hypothetical protein BV20DRAFT_979930 [Pilatotrama ljubarskyi]|nr:hypothetical protein BV20DRAFT_979930 [Pilatotrama ljubarskyi]